MKVTFFRDSDGRLTGFQVKGHAGYDDYGKDIVCSAVSALTLNTVNSVETLCHGTVSVLEQDEEEGFLRFMVENPSKESELLLNSLSLGIRSVGESYDSFIEIDFQEE